MPLIINGTEIEHVIARVNGAEIPMDYVYAVGAGGQQLVYESTVLIAKPTVSGDYTFDTTTKNAVIAGYDPDTMIMEGSASAVHAGTHHVYFTPRDGYAWSDGTKTTLDLTWQIAKRTLQAPTLTGQTVFAWVEGATHTVTDSGFDGMYMTRTGTHSATDAASAISSTYTATWSLRYPNDTEWTGTPSATWTVGWVDGVSHYAADLFDRGWGAGNVTMTSSQSGGSIGSVIHVSSQYSGYPTLYTNAAFAAGATCHAIVRALQYGVHGYNCAARDYPSSTYMAGTTSTEWTEIAWSMTDHDVEYDRSHFGLGNASTGGYEVQRIWVT